METQIFDIIQTLPDSFNSMIDQSINIDTDHAQELIRMLGKKLGIDDYQTNLTTFWLLDTIALEILRINEKFHSPVNLGIFISWIAGEAKFIQDNHFCRSEFFQEMGIIFSKISDQLSKGKSLVYWEEITGINSFEKNQQDLEDVKKEEEKVVLKSNSELRYNLENNNFEDKNEKIQRRHSSSMTMGQKSYLTLASSMEILEAIIESTYAVYANAFHYESVSAGFTKSIEIHSYRLPYTLRFPRVVKLPVLPSVKTGATNEGLRRKDRSKIDEGNPRKNKVKEKSKSISPGEIPPLPPSMTDEEMIEQKRKLILPLMESNEAPGFLEQFANPPIINSTPEMKSEKKGKVKGKIRKQ